VYICRIGPTDSGSMYTPSKDDDSDDYYDDSDNDRPSDTSRQPRGETYQEEQ